MSHHQYLLPNQQLEHKINTEIFLHIFISNNSFHLIVRNVKSCRHNKYQMDGVIPSSYFYFLAKKRKNPSSVLVLRAQDASCVPKGFCRPKPIKHRGTAHYGQTASRSRKSSANTTANTHHRNSVLIEKL